MFRPSSSLHIIVCNIVDFLKEIKFQNSLKEPLRILIMSLQAISWKKDRSLICVLVFTHLDELVKVRILTILMIMMMLLFTISYAQKGNTHTELRL